MGNSLTELNFDSAVLSYQSLRHSFDNVQFSLQNCSDSGSGEECCMLVRSASCIEVSLSAR